MDVDDDAYTDLILISAPMYVEDDREGRVYACTLSGLVNVLIILRTILSFRSQIAITIALIPFMLFAGC